MLKHIFSPIALSDTAIQSPKSSFVLAFHLIIVVTQVDLQAMARVHRVGQTKPVHIYRFVSGGTAEERVVQRAQKKLYLSETVNRGGGGGADEEELEKMSGAEVLS